jgi:hypothetical protein
MAFEHGAHIMMGITTKGRAMAGSGGRPENPEPAQGVRRAVGARSRSTCAAEVPRTAHRIRLGMGKESRVFAISV